MVHVQATIPFLPANAPVGTQVPGFSTMPEKILQYRAEFSPTRVSASDIDFKRHFVLNYVENTMYFETSDLKIHFLMIRNSEITIKYPYGDSYSPQHQ